MTAVKSPDKIGAVPNQPKTKAYAFRLPPAYIDALDNEVAKGRSKDRTDALKRALRQHFSLPEDVDEESGDE